MVNREMFIADLADKLTALDAAADHLPRGDEDEDDDVGDDGDGDSDSDAASSAATIQRTSLITQCKCVQ